MDIVVGSGPSGLAVTLALLARGRRVTMIDGGAVPDGAALARQAELAQISPDDWSAAQVADWQAPQFSTPPGMARRFGSDHAQVPAAQTFSQGGDWFGLRASHAVGGLSDVWGAALLPSRQADMGGWPITADDLAPHYRAVAEVMPVAGRADALEGVFGAFAMAGRAALRPGPQGRELLRRLDGISGSLADQGVCAGQARHAVSDGCKYCGMCLHGCPWNYIFSARHAIGALQKRANFTYLPGRLVGRFSEDGKGAHVHLKDGTSLTGARLFLAAGVLESARIVLASHPEPQTLVLRDSQHFFLPLLHGWRADGDPERTKHHSLTEAFIEIDDAAISPYLMHTQIYGWNEFYARDMMARYGRWLPGSGPGFRALARRLMVAQTFLHSDHSARVELSLEAGGDRLAAVLRENPATANVMAATQGRLAKILRRVGLYGLKFAASAGAPGSSFHSGGTLPMAVTPGAMQTDAQGKLHGLDRVHVVDASVLPAIPATTITFTVMANAHRIGALA